MKTKRQKLKKKQIENRNKHVNKIILKNLNSVKATQMLEGLAIEKPLENKVIQLLKKQKTKEELIKEIMKKYT